MRNFKQKPLLLAAIFTLLFLGAASVHAQSDYRTIRGGVYQDVNGDGRCVNTGVEGEGPVEGVEIFFLSSDKATTVSLYSGENGTYGLAGAGESIWEVTARPDAAKWIVTSENPLYVPVLPESPIQTDVNFCVAQVGTVGIGGGNAVIVLPSALLPESGAAAVDNSWQQIVLITAVAGLLLFAIGLGVEWRRRTNES